MASFILNPNLHVFYEIQNDMKLNYTVMSSITTAFRKQMIGEMPAVEWLQIWALCLPGVVKESMTKGG